MKRLRALHAALLQATGTLAGLAYGAIALLMTLDIAIRSLNLGALGWLTELTEYVLYAATFLAAAWALREAAHVRVDILPVVLGERYSRPINQAMNVMGLAVSAVFLWFGTAAVWEAWKAGATQYRNWATPEWLLLLPLPLAGLLLVIEFVLRLLNLPETVQDVDPANRVAL